MKNFFAGLLGIATNIGDKIIHSSGFRRVTILAITGILTTIDSKTQILDATTKAEIVTIIVAGILGDSVRPIGTPAK